METKSVDHYFENLFRYSSYSVGQTQEIPEIRWKDGKGSYIICGDALTILEKLPDSFIQTVITSPPYYGMRDYGIPGQIGAERYLDDYIAHLVAVFREVRRTLTDDGTIWINISDFYLIVLTV
ncbi:DNA methyltransferase [Methanospirillum hungatei]|uniref:DNA methyltransferase n=1 Tax=Methanospirillum hungatei TaxID=2203 RepID=UPI0026EABEE8|nr:DNA methyltransferase [Methanospirillum hungatei]MCA1917258.1 site-specific DNA-methyltransferase [Methanospirillum hungatei]